MGWNGYALTWSKSTGDLEVPVIQQFQQEPLNKLCVLSTVLDRPNLWSMWSPKGMRHGQYLRYSRPNPSWTLVAGGEDCKPWTLRLKRKSQSPQTQIAAYSQPFGNFSKLTKLMNDIFQNCVVESVGCCAYIQQNNYPSESWCTAWLDHDKQWFKAQGIVPAI